MGSFRCNDSSNVIATLMMTNFHLNTTDVAIFLNVCLWRRSLCSDLVLTLKNCIEPPSYARTAYVVAIWPSFLFDSFVKIWATCQIFWGKWFTAPPVKKFLVRLWQRSRHTLRFWRTRRTSRSRRLARKREFQLLRFDQQITHETFAEFSERVTHTLNNFPIAEIDKTIIQ